MGFFGFGKKERILDLSIKTPEQKPLTPEKMQPKISLDSQAKPSGFFESVKLQQSQQMQGSRNQNELGESRESAEDKKQKFMKKFQETVDRLENLSTQVYHLQQRIEVLEKKMNLGS